MTRKLLLCCLLCFSFTVTPAPAADSAQANATAEPSPRKNNAGRCPIRFGQVEMPTPPGYAEVLPEQYPGYFGSVAYDVYLFNKAGLVRLFIPIEDMPLLEQERYTALRRNIQVALPGLAWPEPCPPSGIPWGAEEEQKTIEELRAGIRDGKIPGGPSASSVDDAAVAAWLRSFPPKEGDKAQEALLSIGFASGRDYLLTFWLGDLSGLISYGLFGNKPAASVMAMCVVDERMLLLFFNQVCASPEDARTVRETAAAYLQAHARDLRVVPAEANVTLNSILEAAVFPPRFVIETLTRQNKPEETLAAARLFLSGYQRHFGDASSATLGIRLLVGALSQQLGKHGEAAAEFERFLADSRAEDPPPARQRAVVLAGLGKSRLALGESDKARETLQQALEAFVSLGESDGLSGATVRLDLAAARAARGDVAAALAGYKQALPVAVALDSVHASVRYACFFNSLAYLYGRAGQPGLAFFYLRLSLDLSLRPGGALCPDEPETEPAGLGKCLERNGRNQDMTTIIEAMQKGDPDAPATGMTEKERSLFLAFREALSAIDNNKGKGETKGAKEEAGEPRVGTAAPSSGPGTEDSLAQARGLARLMERTEQTLGE